MNRILVLGSSGFIGSHIVRKLREQGCEVLGVGRRALPGQEFPYIRLDLAREGAVELFLEEVRDPNLDCIVNCVGGGYVSTSTRQGCEALVQYNIRPIQFIRDLLAKTGIKPKIIHLGSVSSYGVRLGEVISEQTPKMPQTPHEQAKFKAEEKIKQVASEFDLDWVILQPSQVYGPGDNSSDLAKLLRFAKKWRFLPIFGDGKNIMVPLVYVGDVAKIVVECIKRQDVKNEEFILAWERVSWNQFGNIVARLLSVRIVHIHSWLFKAMVFVEDKFFRALGKEPLFSYDRVAYVLGDRLYDSEKVLKTLEFIPTPLEKGLEETIRCLT